MTVIDCIGKYVDQAKARVPIFTNEIYNYVEQKLPNVKKNLFNEYIIRYAKANPTFVRHKRGIYYKTVVTPFGKAGISYPDLIKKVYLTNGDNVIGYESGPSYMNKIGLTTQIPSHSSIEKYEELKRLYNAEEWLTVRETVLQNIWKNNRELLPEILLREGVKDRLLKLAVSYPGLYYIQKYEKDLKQEYAEEILGKYKVEFQKLTESASTRATYREIAKQLRKLSRYDEGKELVRELVAEWKEKYPKRKAMMEELDKVIVTNPKERG